MGTKYLRPIYPIVLKIFQIESSENSVPPNTAKLPTIPPIKIFWGNQSLNRFSF